MFNILTSSEPKLELSGRRLHTNNAKISAALVQSQQTKRISNTEFRVTTSPVVFRVTMELREALFVAVEGEDNITAEFEGKTARLYPDI